MKATGIVRRMDDLGRVVIPKEIRRTMCWEEGDAIEMYVDEENKALSLKKYRVEELDVRFAEMATALKNELSYSSWEKARSLVAELKKIIYENE